METASLRLRDGTRLDAAVWRPDAPGRHPVLLMRQPYGRGIASTVVYAHPAWYAAQGFIVVIQDVRGSGTSEGRFVPYEAEAEDGAETIAWAAGLPGSSGVVGMYGFSYQGAAQTLALSRSPPALQAIAPGMALWDLHAERIAVQAAFTLAGTAGWAAQMGAVVARKAGDAEAYAELAAAANGGMRFDGPVPADPAVLRKHARYNHYPLWHDAPADDPYFVKASSARLVTPATPRVPALFTGGWFDYHLTGTLAGFRALDGNLVIGPWTHLGWSPLGAGADFGPAAHSDMDRMQAQFFAHALRGEDPPAWMRQGRVHLFDLGTRAWRVFDAWPQPASEILHLGGSGLSATRLEDGTLTPDAPRAGTERFVHDPWRPVPAFGLAHGAGQGWSDRAAIDARFDVACFTTAPATSLVTYAGEPAALLHITTDARAFDVNATLSLVTREGKAMALSQGHACVMQGATPDGGLRIAMRPICVTLQPGERLRLSIAGACFPAFPVNPGTGTDPRVATGAEAAPITFAIASGPRASRLDLPRLPTD
jgi:putative CocE/NonD family hydrolase